MRRLKKLSAPSIGPRRMPRAMEYTAHVTLCRDPKGRVTYITLRELSPVKSTAVHIEED